MKIDILIDGISHSGGTDRVACMLANQFDANNHQVTINVINKGMPYYNLSDNVDVVSWDRGGRLSKIMRFSMCCKSKGTDVVIVISMGRLSAEALPVLRLLVSKAKIICSDHVSFQSFNLLIRMIKKISYFCADDIVVLTEHDRKILAHNCFLKNKVSNIGNMSPYETVNCSHEKEDLVLAVGRLTEQKNFLELLSIWKNVNKKKWKLLIVGSGEQEHLLTEYIKKENIESVSIIPSSKKIDYFYRRAKIIAMTSKYEGLPMVLIEAKNYGVASISYDCETGPREIISDDGYIIKYGDVNDFKINLESLISNETQLNIFSENARCNSEMYTSEYIMNKWYKVIGD